MLFSSRFATAEDNKDDNDTSYILGIGAITAFLCFAVMLKEIWHRPYQQRAAVRRQRTVAMEAFVPLRGIAAVRVNRTPLETIHEDGPLEEQHFDRTRP